MSGPKRALSEKQAQRCEQATTPRCKCRCGGQFHGSKRAGEATPDRSFFESLPTDDPHALPKKWGKRRTLFQRDGQRDLFAGYRE
jgi:hypothetical protein